MYAWKDKNQMTGEIKNALYNGKNISEKTGSSSD